MKLIFLRYQCVKGQSCYILLRKDNGKENGVDTPQEAEAMCTDVGGYLANLHPQQEFDAVKNVADFKQRVSVT
mgnify:CR=1 FL=1